MDELIAALVARARLALRTWPNRAGWAFSAGVGALTLGAMGAVGFAGGLYSLHSAQTAGLAGRLAATLVAPAFGEEFVFRALPIPGRAAAPRPPAALAWATAVFTLWHVVEARTFLPAARTMFLRPDFLLCAALLGLGCGVIRWRTGSLWPAVALHWIMVGLWQTWLGGFTL